METPQPTPVEMPHAEGGMVGRIKRILLEPKAEWARIDAEPETVAGIFTKWVLILAAIPAVAGLIGALVFGYGAFGFVYRPAVAVAVGGAVLRYVLTLCGVFVLALIIDGLAPQFGGTKNRVQAMKVAAYSATASWLAGVFGIVPALAILGLLGLYSLYLLYLGLPRLMRVAEDKALPYTLVTLGAALVLGLVVMAVVAPLSAMFIGRSVYGPAAVAAGGGTVAVPGGGSVDLTKLQETAKKLEAGQQAKAVAPSALQALLPAALGDYKRTEISSAGANAGGIGGSEAEARYENGGNSIRLKVTDMAAAGAIAALGSALNVESSRQTATGYEKAGNVDGRMTSEKWDSKSRDGSYSVVVASRFMVEAEGIVPSVDALKQAVGAVGIDRLEAMAK
ncbi:MAG TPA: Yip1 family protein [Allosphingosinicella sp.]|jgi:hypothetical protein